MCVKAVGTCVFVFHSVSDQYKTQKMCNKAVSNDPFTLKYCLGRYKTQGMCDKAVNDFLPALKLVPVCFVTSNMVLKTSQCFIHGWWYTLFWRRFWKCQIF